MKSNGMSIMAECKNCKYKFRVDNTNLSYQKPYVVESDGHEVMLTFYDCPTCGKRHFVQIDDVSTIGYSLKVKGQFKRLAKKTIAGKSVTTNQNANFKNYRTHLSEIRKELQDKYDKQIIIDTDGNKFELRFVNDNNCM